jgi:hypothetical protein
MPRLSPYLEQTVFFIYGRNPSAKPDDDTWAGPLGSGVIVGCHSWQPPVVWSYYAVTARHVIRSGAHAIRINTRDQNSRMIDIGIDEWISRPGEDIAVVDITDRLNRGDAVSGVSFDLLVTDDFMNSVDLWPGDDGFMLGLFTPHSGGVRNRIAARFGNLSLRARKDAPIKRRDDATGDVYESPCHVFDIHSRPGFSGSPVFVYRTPETDIRDPETRSPGWRIKVRNPVWNDRVNIRDDDLDTEMIDETDRSNRFLRLLGIHANQYHDAVTISKVTQASPKNQSAEDANTIGVGDQINFPGSMTIVVPASEIIDLITEDKALTEQRDKRWQEAKNEIERSMPRASPRA